MPRQTDERSEVAGGQARALPGVQDQETLLRGKDGAAFVVSGNVAASAAWRGQEGRFLCRGVAAAVLAWPPSRRRRRIGEVVAGGGSDGFGRDVGLGAGASA